MLLFIDGRFHLISFLFNTQNTKVKVYIFRILVVSLKLVQWEYCKRGKVNGGSTMKKANNMPS